MKNFYVREHSIHASIVLIALFALYAMTMPRVVTFEDSGIFNLACHQGSVAHPPGYPLYSLLCYPFAHLPFITTAFGLNLMSALLGALSCVVLYLIAVLLLRHPVYAYIAPSRTGYARFSGRRRLFRKFIRYTPYCYSRWIKSLAESLATRCADNKWAA